MDKYEKVYARDGYRCIYCGRFLLTDFESWASLHTDHLVPSVAGGDETSENLVTSCPTCNLLKHDFRASFPYEPNRRDEYLKEAREYIGRKRSAWLPDFFEAIRQWKDGEK